MSQEPVMDGRKADEYLWAYHEWKRRVAEVHEKVRLGVLHSNTGKAQAAAYQRTVDIMKPIAEEIIFMKRLKAFLFPGAHS